MCGQHQYSCFLTRCSINLISKPSESLLREATTFLPVVHQGIFLPHMTFPPKLQNMDQCLYMVLAREYLKWDY